MKKVLFGMVAIALAMSAQAAVYLQLRTGSPDAPALTSKTMGGYSAYFIPLGNMQTITGDDTLKVTDVAKVSSYLNSNFDSAWTQITTGKKGVVGATMYWNNSAMNTYTSNTAYIGDAFAVVAYMTTNDGSYSNFRVLSLNGKNSGTFQDWSTSQGVIWDSWTSTTPGEVPEPTSGLLLLLGVAGLALKRKRA